MQDFVVLFKPISGGQQFPNNKKLFMDHVNLSFLMQELVRDHQSIKDYQIDKESIRFETIGGNLCVVMLAFRKA